MSKKTTTTTRELAVQTTTESVINRTRREEGRSKDGIEHLLEELGDLKRTAAAEGHEGEANRIWCIEQALTARKDYLVAWSQLQDRDYYECWCTLERVEGALQRFEKHMLCADLSNDLRTGWLKQRVDDLQSLFPYGLFISPEIIVSQKTEVLHFHGPIG